ncbi:CobT [Acrasis kona]|uniref:CobT n=1 Tax=Acrasis kona TaxID=1008807 RepID=A0AAW2ZQP4_9EUKA
MSVKQRFPNRCFGVEVEYYNNSQIKEPSETDLDNYGTAISNALSTETGLQVDYVRKPSKSISNSWVLTTDETVRTSVNLAVVDEKVDWGMELVSPKLAGRTGLKNVIKVLYSLSNQQNVHMVSSADLHVHIDGSDWLVDDKSEEAKKVFQLFIKYEEVLILLSSGMTRDDTMSVYKKARYLRDERGFDTAKRYHPDDIISALEKAPDNHTMAQIMCNKDRNWCLNLMNWKKDGYKSIEFRSHNGTVDAREVVYWIALLVIFVEHGMKVVGQINSFDEKVTVREKFISLYNEIPYAGAILRYYDTKLNITSN